MKDYKLTVLEYNKVKKDIASKEQIEEVLKRYKLIEPKKIKV